MEPDLLWFPCMVDVERAIADVVERGEVVVPPERGVALGIAALLEGRDVPVDAVARLVSADPGLAVAVLAEAADRDGREAPASLPRAIERIGDAALLRIARAAADGGAHAPGPLAARRRSAWRSAAGCALVARELARLRGLDRDAAWLCGLLHDVGRAAALAAVERLAAGARVQPAPRRWDALVDRWHVSLGLSLAERLRLPRAVADAIALHHGDALDAARSPELVRVVRTAGAVVRGLWDEPLADEDARALADLDGDEPEHLAALVAVLPSAVSALERGGGEPRRARAAPGAVLHESKGEGVRLRLAGREYVAVGVAAHQLVVSGPAPLGEGALLEVELLERRGLVFHARVVLAWAEGDRFGAILMPFALAGPSAQEWQGRVPVGASA
jgi:putative nucleotidyltransferase with HDIG domain